MSFQKSLYRLLVLVIVLFTLSACSENGSSGQPTTMTSVTELPSAVLTLPAGGTLQAFITIGTAVPVPLTISANVATGTFNLGREVYPVSIEFLFTDSSNVTVTVASYSTIVDLTSGDASLSIADTDYDLDSYDNDNDGISNAAELAAGTDPNGLGCVLGFSLIGSCTL